MTNPSPFDPALFDESQASSELRAAVEFLEKTAPPPFVAEPTPEAAEQARRDFESGGTFVFPPPSERAEERTIPGPAGEIPVRIFRPTGSTGSTGSAGGGGEVRGAMLHIHGGGWVVGRPTMNDATNEPRSDALGIAIVSVDYRLAPEHPYPAGPDDCEAAAVWLAENARSEFGADPDRILVGGESAGGHLAAVTTLRMRDRHGFRFCGANLVYGLSDLSGVPSHRAFDDRNLILNSANIRWFTECFVPDAERRRDPDVSPLYADLTGLPPALFTVGSLDPLRDHSLFLYARWVAAGSPAELAVYAGGPHGFDMFPAPEARRAGERIDAFLRRCLE